MWGLLPGKLQLLVVAFLTVVATTALQAVVDFQAHAAPSLLSQASFAATVIGTPLAGLAARAWKPLWRRFPALNSWIFPDLSGKWEGELHSTWIDPKTGARLGPIPATLTIKQGLFDLVVTLKTGESSSTSSRERLERLRSGEARIWYSYGNAPEAKFRGRSQPHDGVAFLEIDPTRRPAELKGRYFTERSTAGDMVFWRAGARPVHAVT